MQSKKKLVTIPVEYASVREVEIVADSIIFGVEAVDGGVVLAVGSPDGGGTPVKRKIWMVATGLDITVEAQNGEFVNTVILPQQIEGKPARVLHAIFVENQDQAITRWQHRGIPR